MPEYTITGVRTGFLPGSATKFRFEGFTLKGVIGDVDPFVDGNLNPPELDPCAANYIEQELAWTKQQVGKTLVCDELVYKAFATNGPVTIKE